MKILIKNGRVIDPASNFDRSPMWPSPRGASSPSGKVSRRIFTPNKTIDATGCIVAPGLVDLAARLREPGHEHEGMLESEMAAAVAGGVTSLVCPPDTDPVLDEPGLVEMLKFRAEKLHQARVFPLGALTRGWQGRSADRNGRADRSRLRGLQPGRGAAGQHPGAAARLQYASTFGYTVWLRPQELWLGKGVAASGAAGHAPGPERRAGGGRDHCAAHHFELMRATGARVHLCRLSSAGGVALVRQAKDDGLPVTCDVSINSLHLTDTDIGYFDSRARLNPPLRQQRDRDALREGLADGTIDALVSDHTPVDEDAKTLPFAEAEPGATGLELLLGLALKWGQESGVGLTRALAVLTSEPARVLGAPWARCRPAWANWWKAAWPTSVCSTRRPPGQVQADACAARASTRRFRATSCRPRCAAPWWAGRSRSRAGTA
jgi:dihydroorotase